MTPYSSGQGLNSTVIVANTVGIQIAVVGVQAASAASAAACAGFLHTISFGGDSTFPTISVYDGTSTSGVLKFKGIAGNSTSGQNPNSWLLDIQFDTGIFIVVSGGTTIAITVTWA